jgi:DNA (cytosine-5)-methyltransferase 1
MHVSLATQSNPGQGRVVGKGLTVAGLFAGIGGIELGFHRSGHATDLLCEIDRSASAVLADRFPGIPLVADVRDLKSLPKCDLVAAGFPCQDLSQAGRTAGISGRRSGLVGEVFRLLSARDRGPTWLMLENVPFMLQLDRGRAMRFLTDTLGDLGYMWAYRVVDSRAFGLPQRRQRVILLASKTEDPRQILFADEAGCPAEPDYRGRACGFYWTEGIRGLGWAVDAVPTLKGGSTIGIPSPPAIWMPAGLIVTPDIRDAERLQGFPAGWTEPSMELDGARAGDRWHLVGNAVSVPVAEWVGSRLSRPGRYEAFIDCPLGELGSWPSAAWGRKRDAYRVDASLWPLRLPREPLATFLQHEGKLLSVRAADGFLARCKRGNLRFQPGFIQAVERHREAMRGELVPA